MGKRARWPEEEGVVCTTVCRQTCVFAFPVQYIWASLCRLYTLLHWLHWTKRSLKASQKAPSFSPFTKTVWTSKKRQKNITFLAWQHPKEAVVFFFFCDLSSSFGTHMHTQEQCCTHTNSSSAAQIWLWLRRSQSERICGIAASSLPQTFSLSPWLHPTPTDFTRELSKGLLYPIPGQTNLLPLKLYTPWSPLCPLSPHSRETSPPVWSACF